MSERPPDAMELHAIGRLVLSAGIGPRWNLSKHARAGRVLVTGWDSRQVEELELWSDKGPSTEGARTIAEAFLDELEHAGFAIVRRTL